MVLIVPKYQPARYGMNQTGFGRSGEPDGMPIGCLFDSNHVRIYVFTFKVGYLGSYATCSLSIRLLCQFFNFFLIKWGKMGVVPRKSSLLKKT